MNTTPFQPKGDVAEWRMVYDHARTLNPGDLITYTELAAILGLPDDADRDRLRKPVYRAQRELELNDRRTLVNVVNEGYRMAKASEHGDLAKHHTKKAIRQHRTALRRGDAADRSLLTPEEAKQIDGLVMTSQRTLDAVIQQTRRVEKVQKALDAAHTAEMGELSNLDEKVTKLIEALERRGITT